MNFKILPVVMVLIGIVCAALLESYRQHERMLEYARTHKQEQLRILQGFQHDWNGDNRKRR